MGRGDSVVRDASVGRVRGGDECSVQCVRATRGAACVTRGRVCVRERAGGARDTVVDMTGSLSAARIVRPPALPGQSAYVTRTSRTRATHGVRACDVEQCCKWEKLGCRRAAAMGRDDEQCACETWGVRACKWEQLGRARVRAGLAVEARRQRRAPGVESGDDGTGVGASVRLGDATVVRGSAREVPEVRARDSRARCEGQRAGLRSSMRGLRSAHSACGARTAASEQAGGVWVPPVGHGVSACGARDAASVFPPRVDERVSAREVPEGHESDSRARCEGQRAGLRSSMRGLRSAHSASGAIPTASEQAGGVCVPPVGHGVSACGARDAASVFPPRVDERVTSLESDMRACCEGQRAGHATSLGLGREAYAATRPGVGRSDSMRGLRSVHPVSACGARTAASVRAGGMCGPTGGHGVSACGARDAASGPLRVDEREESKYGLMRACEGRLLGGGAASEAASTSSGSQDGSRRSVASD